MASYPTRASYDPARAHRCDSGKGCHASKAEALDVTELMMERGAVKPGCHITPYLCDRCHQWHVANKVIVSLPKSLRG